MANPLGSGDEANLAALLRRMADQLERDGITEVQDLVLHRDLTEDGETWLSLTAYW